MNTSPPPETTIPDGMLRSSYQHDKKINTETNGDSSIHPFHDNRSTSARKIQVLLGLFIFGIASVLIFGRFNISNTGTININDTKANTEIDVVGTTTEALVASNTEEQPVSFLATAKAATLYSKWPGNNVDCTINYYDTIFIQSMFKDFLWLTGNRKHRGIHDYVKVRSMSSRREAKKEKDEAKFSWKVIPTNADIAEGVITCLRYGDRFRLQITDSGSGPEAYLSGERKLGTHWRSDHTHLRTTEIKRDKDKFEWKILSQAGTGRRDWDQDPLVNKCVPKNGKVIIQNMNRDFRFLILTGKHPQTNHIHDKRVFLDAAKREYSWIIGTDQGTGARNDTTAGCVYLGGSWNRIAGNVGLDLTERISITRTDTKSTTDFFQLGYTGRAEAGFAIPEGPTAKVSSTISAAMSRTIVDIAEHVKTHVIAKTCTIPCLNGVLYQWRVSRNQGEVQGFAESCNLLCVSNVYLNKEPQCPLSACDVEQGCQCCTRNWSDDADVDQHMCPPTNAPTI